MDKATIRDHLAQVEEHVQLGLTHIAEQHTIISDLVRLRLDATMALGILTTFEDAQRSHVADHNRLAKAEAE